MMSTGHSMNAPLMKKKLVAGEGTVVVRNQSKKDVGGRTTNIKRFRPIPISHPFFVYFGGLKLEKDKCTILRSVVYLHKTI